MYPDVPKVAPKPVTMDAVPTYTLSNRTPSVSKQIIIESFIASIPDIQQLQPGGSALQFEFTTDVHDSLGWTAATDKKIKEKVRRDIRSGLEKALKGVDLDYKQFSTAFRFLIEQGEGGEFVNKGAMVFLYRA